MNDEYKEQPMLTYKELLELRQVDADGAKEMSKQKNSTCKYGKFSYNVDHKEHKENEELGDDSKMIKDFYYTIKNDGCQELRRNGSAYCQKCSDQYHDFIDNGGN